MKNQKIKRRREYIPYSEKKRMVKRGDKGKETGRKNKRC